MTGSSHSASRCQQDRSWAKTELNVWFRLSTRSPLFGGLGPSQVQAVLGACKPMRFEEGDVLCAADTPGEELFILLTGQVGV